MKYFSVFYITQPPNLVGLLMCLQVNFFSILLTYVMSIKIAKMLYTSTF